jgi:hypothetical protein
MKIVRERDLGKQVIATMLVALLPLLLQPAMAQSLTTVQGTVFAGLQGRALEGARVHLIDPVTNVAYSANTSSDGSYAIEGVPAATYDSGIEFQGGLYLVEESVVVAGGKAHALNLSVPHLAKKAKPAKPATLPKGGKQSFLNNPLTAALALVAGAFTVGLIMQTIDDDDEASPFNI